MPINYKNYPANWKSEIRPAILERAKHKCEFCEVNNYAIIHRFGKGLKDWSYWPEGMESEVWSLDGLKSVKIVLTVAHLDHNIANNDFQNLKALCQRCHNQHDVGFRKQNRRRNKSLITLF
jgi:hypothetical protein